MSEFLIVPLDEFRKLARDVQALKEAALENSKGKKQDQERYLTSEEVCEKLGISKKTLYTWRKFGVISCIKRGSFVRFRISDIAAALDRYKSTGRL